MARITSKTLEGLMDTLNELAGTPMTMLDVEGRYNVGHFYLHESYSGVSIYQVANKSGGAREFNEMGHVSNRECYQIGLAFAAGLRYAKDPA